MPPFDCLYFCNALYDGWNPTVKYGGPVNVAPTLSRAYLWGLDLSGSRQGAGGVGGHLAVDYIGSGVYYPLADGNGNITEYVDTSGTVVAHYRYDPFGRTLFQTGTHVGNFEFRFSTKRIDPETGCYYYGYRYYNPYIGRWLNRDPIGERGGVNLYGFVGNDAVNGVDVLGLQIGLEDGALIRQWEESCCKGRENPKAVGITARDGQGSMFRSIAANGGAWTFNPSSAAEMFENLRAVTSESRCNCISTLTLAGHGFGAGMRGYDGIPFDNEGEGLYPTTSGSGGGARSFGDLDKEITSNRIRFCKKCTIQIHACRISDVTIQGLSRSTGCRVVAAAGSCIPGADKDGNGVPDEWNGVPGTWPERELPNGFRESTAGSPVSPVPSPPVPGSRNSGSYVPK